MNETCWLLLIVQPHLYHFCELFLKEELVFHGLMEVNDPQTNIDRVSRFAIPNLDGEIPAIKLVADVDRKSDFFFVVLGVQFCEGNSFFLVG